MLTEFSRIRRFLKRSGRKNDVLRVNFFPPSIHLNRRLASIFSSTYVRYASKLLPWFERLLAEAWRHQTKGDYNLLVMFRDCCRRLSCLNLHVFIQKNSYTIDSIRHFEQLYLSCLYDPTAVRRISDIFRETFYLHPEWDSDLEKINELVMRLFAKSGPKPYLQEVVLALNMARYSRYLTLNDLIADNLQIIPTYDFICTDEIRSSIDSYLASQEQELLRYMKEKIEIEKIERFVPLDSRGEVSFTLLAYYYESQIESKIFSLKNDFETIPLFVYNFYTMYMHYFDGLLCGRSTDSHGRRITLVETEYVVYQLNRLKMLIEKLYRLKYVFKNIGLERFALLKHSLKTGTSGEVEIMQSIDEALEISRQLAEHIIDRLRSFHLQNEDGSHQASALLTGPGFLKEKPAIHCIHDAVTLLLLAGIKLKDNSIPQLLSRRDRLQKDIQGIHANLERVATRERYNDFLKNNMIENEEKNASSGDIDIS